MSFWRNFFRGSALVPSVVSPWAPASDMVSFAINEALGGMPSDVMTRELALRVPGVKRAHGIHCSIVAGLPFRQMAGDKPVEGQPEWLTNSESGISPYARMFGVVSDLFFHGWAVLGFTADKSDALHIPFGLWSIDPETGTINADQTIDEKYRQLLVAIPLGFGENGVIFDATDTIRAARNIERAWMERVENPAPATELHITDTAYDQMSAKEKRKMVDQWNENRRRSGGQTAVTPSFIEVRALGQTSADLFEKGRNAIRLDLANHCAVPASIIEGAKDGSAGDMSYSNDMNKRNELYEFGTKKFVQAIEARLSLDDVCPSGESIRADLTGLMAVPTPNTNPTSED